MLHIPHASTEIPDYTGFLLRSDVLQTEIQKLTDWHTDELFVNTSDVAVVAPFSRVFCDVERFTDDSLEPMAKYGMGVLYEKTDNGKPMRELTTAFKAQVLQHYYNTHHRKLTEAVEQELAQQNSALLIDCHSFPDTPLQRDIDQHPQRPGFNLGTDPYHTPPELTRRAQQFFTDRGFTVAINRPYAGTLVPLRWYNNDKRVSSLMLEVNRRLYLKPDTSERSDDFETIKALVHDFLDHIRKSLHQMP
ncbi:N-formylglutamate amidohydrolase [uncultured Draconibacterium sp.]|uniref:N-formylglutamate amidohydrolase n=1 Tax=uncultured Draconibacterium sp. TaxID=1573823 RepID=UPI0029C89EB9|nr:N-formylglutamate amidohydrolase [uncultured Draconibacterium sp.]